MPLHVSSTCAHHQEVKIVLYSLRYHHTPRWPSGAQFERVLSQPVHETATYRCDDTRGCVMQFWPPDDEHICSKHVEAWNKLTVKQKFCASSWLITEIKSKIQYLDVFLEGLRMTLLGRNMSPWQNILYLYINKVLCYRLTCCIYIDNRFCSRKAEVRIGTLREVQQKIGNIRQFGVEKEIQCITWTCLVHTELQSKQDTTVLPCFNIFRIKFLMGTKIRITIQWTTLRL